MDHEQFSAFAVELLDIRTGLFVRAFLVHVSEDGDSFLIDFSAEKHPSPIWVSRGQVYLPRDIPRARQFRLGDEVEVLARKSPYDAWTWYKAVILGHFLHLQPPAVYAKVQLQNSERHMILDHDDVLGTRTQRQIVEKNHFVRRILFIPLEFQQWLTANQAAFAGMWHNAFSGTKLIKTIDRKILFLCGPVFAQKRYTESMFRLLDSAAMSQRTIEPDIATAMTTYLEHHRNGSGLPIFWHGEPWAKKPILEDHPARMTTNSIFYRRPMTTTHNPPDNEPPTASHINNLPDELLLRIFQFLDVSDRRTMMRVSSGWRTVLQFPLLQRCIAIKLERFKSDGSSFSHQLIPAMHQIFLEGVKHLVLLCDNLHMDQAPKMKLHHIFQLIQPIAKLTENALDRLTIASASISLDLLIKGRFLSIPGTYDVSRGVCLMRQLVFRSVQIGMTHALACSNRWGATSFELTVQVDFDGFRIRKIEELWVELFGLLNRCCGKPSSEECQRLLGEGLDAANDPCGGLLKDVFAYVETRQPGFSDRVRRYGAGCIGGYWWKVLGVLRDKEGQEAAYVM